jgi:hypothetical protein
MYLTIQLKEPKFAVWLSSEETKWSNASDVLLVVLQVVVLSVRSIPKD